MTGERHKAVAKKAKQPEYTETEFLEGDSLMRMRVGPVEDNLYHTESEDESPRSNKHSKDNSFHSNSDNSESDSEDDVSSSYDSDVEESNQASFSSNTDESEEEDSNEVSLHEQRISAIDDEMTEKFKELEQLMMKSGMTKSLKMAKRCKSMLTNDRETRKGEKVKGMEITKNNNSNVTTRVLHAEASD